MSPPTPETQRSGECWCRAMITTDPTDIRLSLLIADYLPLPLRGKKPAPDEWQKKLDRIRPGLTKFTPAIDIDIMVPDAAAAIEDLARQWFGEHGDILVRFGEAPKRAVILRTDEPFKKIVDVFTAPDGKEQKIEVLGDGQQIVVHGTHPDTHEPYSWHGGAPWTTPREQLPYAREAEARAFLNEASQLLIDNFGFVHKGGSKKKATNGTANDTEHRHRANWGELFSNLFAGEHLHDSILELAASFIGIGMSEAAAVERLQSLMDASKAPKDERWRERCDDIPRAVRSAKEKFGKPTPSLLPELGHDCHLIQSSAEFVANFEPSDYVVDGVVQRQYVYAVTGSTGAGKTAILLLISAHAALGRPIGDRGVQRVTVIYFAGENPVDVRMRWIAMAQQMDFDVDTINVHFIPGVFKFLR